MKLSVVFFPCHWQPVQFTTASDNVFTQRSWSSLTFRVLFDPLTQPNCSMLPRERRQRGDIPLLIPLSLCPGRNSLWQPQLGSVAAATTRHISTQTERDSGGGKRGARLVAKVYVPSFDLMWESTAHTHTHRTGVREKDRGPDLCHCDVPSASVCVFLSDSDPVEFVSCCLQPSTHTVLHTVTKHMLITYDVYTMNILNASTQTFWVNWAKLLILSAVWTLILIAPIHCKWCVGEQVR